MWTAVYDESATLCTMWRPAWTHPRVASGGVGESRCLGGEIHCPGDPIGLPIRAWARSVAAGWPVMDWEVWVLPRPDGPGSRVLRADGRPLSQNDPAVAIISARRARARPPPRQSLAWNARAPLRMLGVEAVNRLGGPLASRSPPIYGHQREAKSTSGGLASPFKRSKAGGAQATMVAPQALGRPREGGGRRGAMGRAGRRRETWTAIGGADERRSGCLAGLPGELTAARGCPSHHRRRPAGGEMSGVPSRGPFRVVSATSPVGAPPGTGMEDFGSSAATRGDPEGTRGTRRGPGGEPHDPASGDRTG